ncbi:MAG: hypothetical protein OEV27_15945 [Nitrospira sp.]|jgi:hypothetical protein|nr:hypothetical protein [Nitrospira sp.]MDH4252671.1 hypothetical protein [Nitrospira sp.]MDH4343937.1 hypothetical protein [Nitrospira sp.]MDH5336343.1 hypothetical protein [Nitrospira sp.]
MSTTKTNQQPSVERWVRIPDGTKVRHRSEAYDGVIDGLTEIVSGSERNPDGKTQYRVNVGDSTRLLVTEDHLNILVDNKNMVLLARESELYRRSVTDRLRAVFPEDRFVTTGGKVPASKVPASIEKSQ